MAILAVSQTIEVESLRYKKQRGSNQLIQSNYRVFKETPEFSCTTKTVVTSQPCFFLLKTEIHMQIFYTEPILYNFR